MTGGGVVVLGPTGRNFGAGMSGGFAWVLDEDGRFASRCNLDGLELATPSDDDADAVHALIEEHVALTRSVKGKSVLSAWSSARAKLVKVVPVEYARVLAARRALKVAGDG